LECTPVYWPETPFWEVRLRQPRDCCREFPFAPASEPEVGLEEAPEAVPAAAAQVLEPVSGQRMSRRLYDNGFRAGDDLNGIVNMAQGESALRLTGQTPLRARVCDPEPFALGVALGVAARLRDHHRQLAAVVVGVAHTLSQERGL